ncbi:MAG: hypothetical protein HYY02_01615 [Chloroflexi bacterium]|nr:hypothetical protein [Chloroflexota bacterium]
MSYSRVIVAGLIASMVMGMWEMVVEQLVGGNGFWSPVTYIAATVLRDYQQVGTPVPFAALPVALGLMAHMMNSVILAAAFALIAGRVHGSLQGSISLGAGFGAAVMLLMWFLVLPVADPVMLRLNPVSFLVAHMMWGAALGLLLEWTPGLRHTLRSAPA